MRKYINIITLSLFVLLTSTSCADFLDENLEDGFAAQTLFDTPEGLESMVKAIYSHERALVKKGDANSYLGAHLYGERTTDLSLFLTGSDANLGRYTDPTPTSNINNLLYNPVWESRYYVIGRTNEIIHYGTPMGDDAKLQVAEGSFWRAYQYFNLWVRFSRVYLNTEPVTIENMDKLVFVPADSAAVFSLMYEDAQRAIDGLPYRTDDKNTGRVFRATAQHLKALIAAWANDWNEVARLIDAMDAEIGQSGLGLIGNTKDIFNRADYYDGASTETLYALRFSNQRGGGTGADGTQGHRIGSQYGAVFADVAYAQPASGAKYNIENMGKQWALALPNSYLLSLYEAGDNRLDAYYKRNYTYANANRLITIPVATEITDAQTGQTYWSSSNRTSAPYTVAIGDRIYGRDIAAAGNNKLDRREILPSSLKQIDLITKPIDSDGPHHSFKDVMVYRLSESYLLGAEAYLKLDNQAKAKYYFNKTYNRATGSDVSGDITFDMLRDEHARELAFEGRRFEFLKRNNIWYSQMKSYSGDFTTYPTLANFDKTKYGISDGRDAQFAPNANYYADFSGSDNDVLVRFNVKPIHRNWPIPHQQIQAMGASFPQTEGYY